MESVSRLQIQAESAFISHKFCMERYDLSSPSTMYFTEPFRYEQDMVQGQFLVTFTFP